MSSVNKNTEYLVDSAAITSTATNSNVISQLFNVCDLDGSGDIDRYELAQICPNLSQSEIDNVFKDLDKNNDGLISFAEFCQGFKELLPPMHDLLPSKSSKAAQHEEVENTDNKAVLFHKLDQTFKSLSCQELICDFYQTFSQENPENVGLFEKILFSVIEDVQKYQKEVQRLESSYAREKEQNEKFFKQIEEEAENQLKFASDRIKNEERHKWEIEREQLKQTFRNEISELQASISQMESIEQKYKDNKNDDDSQVLSLKTELDDLVVENRHLKSSVTESQTQLAVLRSEMATLKAQYEEKQNEYEFEKRCNNEIERELNNLKQQVHILHEANKRLHDTNDDLRAHIETVKIKSLRPPTERDIHRMQILGSSPNLRKDSILSAYIQNSDKIQCEKANKRIVYHQGITANSGLTLSSSNNINNRNHIVASRSFDVDSEDLDSGISTINGGITEVDSVDNEHSHASLDRTKYTSSINDELNTSAAYNDYYHSEVHEDGVFEGEEESFNDSLRQLSLSPRSNMASSLTRRTIKRSNINNSTESIAIREPLGPPDRMFKVVFAGDAAVGKSSFIMRFCKGKFVCNLNSTLGVDFQMKLIDVDGKTTAVQLWDTCGQERFRAIAKSYFRRADGIVLMYDCTYERSFLNVREWISTIQEATDKKLPVILVANKIDLRDEAREEGRKVVEYEDGLKLSRENEALFIETSAKDGTNIYESLVEIARVMRCNEDIEVKSSGFKITSSDKKKTCCWSSNS